MASRAAIRASDADRERAAERLRQAAAEGRLLTEELEQRLEASFSARTYGQLNALVADLPGRSLAAPAESRRLPSLGSALALALAIPVTLAIVAAVVFAVTGVLTRVDPFKALQGLAECRSGEETQSSQRRKCGRECALHFGFTWMMAIMPRSSWDKM